MNKQIYRSIWNSSLGSWVAASEVVKGSGKQGSFSAHSVKLSLFKARTHCVALAVACLFGLAPVSHAANWINAGEGDWFGVTNWDTGTVPTGTTVNFNTGGTANINSGGAASATAVSILDGTLKINQGGTLNLSSFSLGSSSASATVNVNGGSVTSTGVSNIGNGAQEALLMIDNNGTFTSGQYLRIGNTGKGKMVVNSGTVNVNSGYGIRIAEAPGSEGYMVVNGGTVHASALDKYFLIGYQGAGKLEINNNGWVDAAYVFVGGQYLSGVGVGGGTGTVILNDNAVLEGKHTSGYSSGIFIGSKDSSGTVIVNDNSTLRAVGDSIYVGNKGSGTLILNGGLVSSGQHVNIAHLSGSHGDVTVNGGVLNVGAFLYVGSEGIGSLTINPNGTVNVANVARIGNQAGSNGTVTVSGGVFNAGNALYIGSSGTGTFNLNSGRFTQNNRTWIAGTGATGTLNLNGGVFETQQLSGNTGNSTFNFNGGVLKALSANTGFVKALSTFKIGADATVDSNGFNIGFTSAMTGNSSAMLTKKGSGTLTLNAISTGYYGGVTVDQGVLALTDFKILRNADSVTVNAQGKLVDLYGVQALNHLSGEDGAIIEVVGGSQTTLNNLAGRDTVFLGTLNSMGTVIKDGPGALTLGNNSQAQDFFIFNGKLNIGPDKTLTVVDSMVINALGSSNSTLGVTASHTPAVVSHTAQLLNTPTIDVIGFDFASGAGPYTIIRTTGGIIAPAGFMGTVGDDPLSTVVTLDKYMIGSIYLDATSHNLLADLTLVWNNAVNAGAHGTFNISAGNTFGVSVALEDKSGATLGFGWNGTTLDKLGEGTLLLDGVNTYAGLTNVQAGKLVVGSTEAYDTATIAGDVHVGSDATLGGHGQILGSVQLASGSTVAPGNSIGTMTVGDITFEAGSTYEFEADADGTADKINVTGVAVINAGTVSVLANGNIWSTTDLYTILSAGAGVTGTFSDLISNLAFLNGELIYDANNVYLKLKRNTTGMGGLGGTSNQKNTGKGIESLRAGNAIYARILSMDRMTALNSFDNLSGEIHASVHSALLVNSRYVRRAVNEHLQTQFPEPGNHVWGQIWGHDGRLKNDGNAAQLNNKGAGFLFGADIPVNETTQAGIAAGYEQTKTDIAGTRQSDADINAYHVMLYGKTQAGYVDLKGGIGYARLDIDTNRNIWVAGLQGQNKASYNGHQVQAFIEGSHTFQLNEQIQVSPYVNLSHTQLKTNSFKERGNITALVGHGKTNRITVATVGAKGQVQVGEQKQHRLYADIGLQARSGDKTPEVRMNFAGGLPHSIRGVNQGNHSVLIGLGADLLLKPNLRLTVSYDGEYGSQVKDNAVKAQLMWKF